MSIDSIVGAVSAMQQSRIESQIATAIASKQMDAIEQQGQAAVELLEAAVAIQKDSLQGTVLDVRV